MAAARIIDPDLKPTNVVFPKLSGTFTEFSEFRETDHRWSMNWAQFEDPVSHMCLACAVVACWSLLHNRWLSGKFEPFYCNDKFFDTEFSEFSENI